MGGVEVAEIPFIVVPKVLREHLGEEGAEALVGLLNQLAAHELREFRLGVEAAVNNLAATMTREISSLRARMDEGDNALRAATQEGDNALRTAIREVDSALRSAIREVDSALRLEMREGFANLRTEMHALVNRTHVSLIKWMFAFWLGQVAVILGILKLLGAI